MSSYEVHTNSVGKEASRIIHLKVMKAISDIVMETAGPRGSTTMIMQNNGTYPMYSKDGKKVLEHINIFGEVERGILDQFIQITEKIVSRVGDGTTSAARLTYLVFKELVEMENDTELQMNTYEIIDCFHKATECVIRKIEESRRDLEVEDVYDICMISTNGNESLSTLISDIYREHGTEVYIDLKTSTTSDYMKKSYDGLTINKGYASPAYANRSDDTCDLRNPKIYVFRDPVDTPEMIGYFTKIVQDNIIVPFNNLRELNAISSNPREAQMRGVTTEHIEKLEAHTDLIPTLIMVPFISRDVASTLESLESLEYQFDKDESSRAAKPPIAIVTNLSQNIDELSDISLLCECKVIGKYIDAKVQEEDIRAGKAPTIDNVCEFCGTAEQVLLDKEKTVFINPVAMFEMEGDEYVLDENGDRKYSTTYTSLVSFLRGQLKECEENGESVVEINRLKRRLTGLVSSLVELYIGGISVTDRESDKDLADDAIRNCRSAAISGVGRAANFEGLLASMAVEGSCSEKVNRFVSIIKNAYTQVVKDLYAKSIPANMVDKEFEESVRRGMPVNLRTLKYSNNVLTSIDTDIAILDCISRIVTIMFTSNQILVTSAFDNAYAGIIEKPNTVVITED